MSKNTVSKFISLILRHRPETIGISLDEHGWADVGELIEGVSKTHHLDMETLEDIVKNDSKQRYSFSEDKRLIRANQGHSIPVDVELKQTAPPDIRSRFILSMTERRTPSTLRKKKSRWTTSISLR